MFYIYMQEPKEQMKSPTDGHSRHIDLDFKNVVSKVLYTHMSNIYVNFLLCKLKHFKYITRIYDI